MNAAAKSERQSNYELLRIIAMLMIVAHHLVIHGVMHNYAEGFNNLSEKLSIWSTGSMINKIYSAFLLPGGQIGVALFFMITGYFLIDRNESGKIHKLIYEGIFYAAIEVIILVLAIGMGFSYHYTSIISVLQTIVSSFFATYSNWWFFYAYIFLLLVFPTITYYFNKFNKNGQRNILIFFGIFVYCVNMFLENSVSVFIRAIFFFLIGGYIRHFAQKLFTLKKKWLLIFLMIISWLGDAIVLYWVNSIHSMNTISLKMKLFIRLFSILDYGLFVPLCACSIFLLFSIVKLRNRYVNILSATTFGIYLFHDNVVTREIIWKGILKVDTLQYSSNLFILYSALSVIGIFFIGVLIDLVRERFFTPMAEKNWKLINDRVKKYIL